MSDRPTSGGWDDGRIDRLLGEALLVEPSPDLCARVRARVADEPVLSIRPAWPWVWAGAAAAMVGLALIAVPAGGWWSTWPQINAGRAQPALPGHGLAPWTPFADGAPHDPVPAIAPAPVRVPASMPDWPATSRHGAQPLFAPGDRAAFRLLLAYSRAAQPAEAAAAPLTEPGMAATALLPVTIPPIEIADIDIPAPGAEGVTEGEPQ